MGLKTVASALGVLAALVAAPVAAQVLAPYTIEVRALSTDTRRLSGNLTWQGTGFYIDQKGRLMTAAHVVKGCRQVAIVKGDFRVAPTRISVDTQADLAVLETGITHGLAATFAADPIVRPGENLLTIDFSGLQQIAKRTPLLSNAFVSEVTNRADVGRGEFAMLSGAAPGASGSPIIDDRGLVVGMVRAQRTIAGPGAPGLNHSVLAPSRAQLTGFLDAAGIAFRQSAAPQLTPEQSRRDRIGSITAGIYCA